MDTHPLKQLQSLIHATLRHWHKPDFLPDPRWERLLLLKQVAPILPDGCGDNTRAGIVRQLISEALEDLAVQDPLGADVLQRRFWERHIGRKVATDLGTTRDSVNRIQKKALRQLADLIATKEEALRTKRLNELERNLPAPTYTNLFGLQQIQADALERLTRSAPPWILTITGLGGIGKTALADAVTRSTIGTFVFEKVAWMRFEPFHMNSQTSNTPDQILTQVITSLYAQLSPDAAPMNRQQQEAHLLQAFKTKPHLVVIDNLEREADVAFLFNHLAQWTNPSKFLLTTRAVPISRHNAWTQSLEELSLADSVALIRHEAGQARLNEIVQADEDALLPIYNLTGGNPLALKLVIGLAQAMPLPAILAELAQSQPGPTEEMYRHIYWKAWQSLSDPARQLLEAMPLIGDPGARPEQMQAMSELGDELFWTAVRQLVTRSLLEVRGTAWERRYGIHRLTETFLQTEIIQWPDDKSA